MARDLAALGPGVIEVSFWHRKIGTGELAAVIRAREFRLPVPATRPGLEEEMRVALQADAAATNARPPVRSGAGQMRAEVMGALDAKLGHILGHVHAEMAPAVATPVRLLASGEGLTFWSERTDLSVGDLLEVRLPLFPDSPIPMHGYCRVRRVRREWSQNGVRVDCAFETMDALKSATAPPPVEERVAVPPPATPPDIL
ncbi:MAG: PilZ domain-containing protein, partial [Magnetococcales bacterium]|nr:PilZ domain-containing protein [Magnetococcales bacterium]